MGQPTGDKQVRAVALREAVASLPPASDRSMTGLANHERYIIERSERFADYIENGVHEDAEGN